VIGGGAARAGELLLEPAKRVAMGYVLPGLGRATNIRLAWHGVRSGVLGAALLAAHELEEARLAAEGGGSAIRSQSGTHVVPDTEASGDEASDRVQRLR
jgi:hypothetical protein